MNVLPDAEVAISGDRAVVVADVSTRKMLGAARFADSYLRCRQG
jgi:hypothetical protein